MLALVILGYALATALWLYSEALLSTTIVAGLLGGVLAGLLGWIGVSIASLAKLPLLRLLQPPSSRRSTLLLASVALLLSAIPASMEGGVGLVMFYLLASIAYGLVSASIMVSVLNDVDYSDWGVTLTSASIATYMLALVALIAWSTLDLNLGAPLALASATVTAFLALTLRPQLIPSITLKTVDVVIDLISLRRSPEIYKSWEFDVIKLALILGGLGALKVTLLSTTMRDHGVNTVIALTTGSLVASIIAAYTLKPRIAMIAAVVISTTILILENQLLELALTSLAITYSNLTIVISTLEITPKALSRTLALTSIATALGAILVGALSLANPQIAPKILTVIATLTLITAVILTLRRGREWS
jgi:hypothetical protein